VRNPKEWFATTKESSTAKGMINWLTQLRDFAILRNAKSMAKCAVAAREIFQKLFHDDIQQLLSAYPPDAKNDHGLPFWTGLKRIPQPLQYTPGDPLHELFIRSYVRLLCVAFGHPYNPSDDAVVSSVAQGAECAPFELNGELEIPASDETGDKGPEAKAKAGLFSPQEHNTVDSLYSAALAEMSGWKGNEVEFLAFEKDDDLIIDFIQAAANLRARNYKLKECDRVKIQFVAGRIIPALATTTALIVGGVLGELTKVAQGFTDIRLYKHFNIDISVNTCLISPPTAITPLSGKDYDPNYGRATAPIAGNLTSWDRIDVTGPKTFRELFKLLEEERKILVKTVQVSGNIIFDKYGPLKHEIDTKIELRYEDNIGHKLPSHQKSLRLRLIAQHLGTTTMALLPDIRNILPPH
jgi:ubiquitin-activating enzyme E1